MEETQITGKSSSQNAVAMDLTDFNKQVIELIRGYRHRHGLFMNTDGTFNDVSVPFFEKITDW